MAELRVTATFPAIAFGSNAVLDEAPACVYYPPGTEHGQVEIPGEERVIITGPAFSRSMFERAFAALTESSNVPAAVLVPIPQQKGGGSAL
jgi:hypothetical protein